MLRAAILGLAMVVLAGPAAAFTPRFDAAAEQLASRSDAAASAALPVGPWTDAGIETRPVQGALTVTAWRIEAPGTPTLALLAPLRDQIVAAGYQVVFECDTAACGGFDFRYGIDVLPEPDMHVDLGDFRYLSAVRSGPDGTEALALLVSRTAQAGYVQLSVLGGQAPAAPAVASGAGTAPDAPAVVAPPAPAGPMAARLEGGLPVVLEDLGFETGSDALQPSDYASLAELAGYLRANPTRRVTLVGHTDAAGGLEANIALSRRRAQAVRDRLITAHGIPAGQIEAAGVGYLVPRASNLTEEGRLLNRRVEVVLTSTQ